MNNLSENKTSYSLSWVEGEAMWFMKHALCFLSLCYELFKEKTVFIFFPVKYIIDPIKIMYQLQCFSPKRRK